MLLVTQDDSIGTRGRFNFCTSQRRSQSLACHGDGMQINASFTMSFMDPTRTSQWMTPRLQYCVWCMHKRDLLIPAHYGIGIVVYVLHCVTPTNVLVMANSNLAACWFPQWVASNTRPHLDSCSAFWRCCNTCYDMLVFRCLVFRWASSRHVCVDSMRSSDLDVPCGVIPVPFHAGIFDNS